MSSLPAGEGWITGLGEGRGGGGNDHLAQGGGQATAGQVETFFAGTKDYILMSRSKPAGT